MERKLTAILSADVKGYSRLMGEDEEATVRTLTAYREVMATLIRQHRGRVVDSPGDNLLAEFASVVDAVRYAVVIQTTLKAENADLPPHRKMEFRIGINLGDVVVEGERIYGDGVNIAARLEGLAEPGGICISGTIYDHVKNKLGLGYEYLGEQTVKNITEPVRVYRVQIDEGSAPMVDKSVLRQAQHERFPTPVTLSQSKGDQKRRAVLILVGLVLLGAVVVVGRNLYLRPSPGQPQGVAPTIPQAVVPSEQALPLPDKPSIAVLPFLNMSEDPKQEYFSDGLTEDLITDLSRISGLFVIARNSVFFYKGKAVKVGDISKELGVQYVLEGSVRRADNRVRITAQLVDATTGHHLWAERYDRPLQDIFALQDEIRQKIVTTLKLQLTLWEQGIQVRKRTDNLEAYDYFLRGQEYYWRWTRNAQARQMFERAVELDSEFALAYAWLGWTYWQEWIFQWSPDPQALERAFELAQKAVALDDSLPTVHLLLGYGYLWKKQYEQAIAEGKKAIAVDPNYANGYADLGFILSMAGRPEEAIGLLQKAMRLNPNYPPYYLSLLGVAYSLTGRYEEAIEAQKRVLARHPDYWFSHADLAVIYSELGREEEARAEVSEVLKMNPNYSLESVKQKLPYKDPAVLERYLAALRRAGLK